MKLSIFLIILYCATCLAAQDDWTEDSYIYKYMIDSGNELKDMLKIAQEDEDIIQYASKSVCYDELGCFDKEGTFKHVKQLPEPPESVNAQFFLYTRKNRDKPQMLDYKNPETITNSNIDKKLPLKFITHGFGGRRNLTWVMQMKDAFLKMHDLNVIVVDWSLGARVPYYIQACVNSELVGATIAVLYFYIKEHIGIQEKDLHLIGFSLGTHVMGFAGKRMQEMQGTKPGRITGLDPASPLFEDYGPEVHLYKDDADFLDVIHTNADYFMYGGVGIGKELGHVDFYPNGGKRQPGCPSTIKGLFNDIFGKDKLHKCNHERAVHLFTDSILNPDSCQYIGYKCENYTSFQAAKCTTCEKGCGRMGYNVDGTGSYYLMTKSKAPFCGHLSKLSVNFSTKIKKSYGSIILTLTGADNSKENVTLTEKEDKLIPGDKKTAAITVSSSMRPIKSVEALYIRYDGYIKKGSKTFSLDHVTIEDTQDNYVYRTCEDNVELKTGEYKTLRNC